MPFHYLSSPGAFVPAYPASPQRNGFDFMPSPTFTGLSELHGVRLLDPASQTMCVGFFSGFTTPATLIAGTSFAALFALSKRVKDTSFRTRREIMCLRMYHVFSLLSLLLSLMTVLGSQAALHCLLCPIAMPKNVAATSIYEVLQSTMNFEFLLTRWSFIMSILCFLQCTFFRMVVEFDLFFKKSRRTAATMVTSAFMGIGLALLGYLDSFESLAKWPSFWEMTKELGMIIWTKIEVERHPLQIASLSCFCIALLSLCKFLLPGSIEEEKLADNERFT
ncbi:unnamed protein product [Cylindrotheca closterium]|uniref:Uncharacterized protein n=1 Tax=Cylindrotheca closterium TaxID=2856 RepID=A0AAD2FSP2_9STRA|nr:unnamed protein product [Cylindrotheca closterium]